MTRLRLDPLPRHRRPLRTRNRAGHSPLNRLRSLPRVLDFDAHGWNDPRNPIRWATLVDYRPYKVEAMCPLWPTITRRPGAMNRSRL